MHLLYSLKHIKLPLLSFNHNVLIFTENFIHYKFINDKIQIIYGYIKNTWIMYNLTNNCNNLFIKDRNFFQHIFLSRVGTFLYILILLKRNIKNIIIGANFRRSLCGAVLSASTVIYSTSVCACWSKPTVSPISGI